MTRTADGQLEHFEGACPPLDECMARLAGPSSVDCGIVPLGDDPAVAMSCAREAYGKGQAFRVAFFERGKDSKIATVWVRDEQGQLYRAIFDSDAHGGGRDRPTINRYACDELQANAAESSEVRLLFVCTRWREPRSRCAPID